MKVTSFKLLDRDLTANTHGTSQTDQNGETAALIKVVTSQKDFNFDGGSMSVITTIPKAGEIWVYIPRRSQKITISHAQFGVLRDYYYPVPIEGARTYEMVLDLDISKNVTMTTQVPGSTIFVDGVKFGVSPVTKQLLYGTHKVSAENGKMVGEISVDISKTGASSFDIPMKNTAYLYGNVIISVDGNADIYYNGEMKGVGSWSTELKAGDYVVETRKANCENVKTPFTVVAQKTNRVNAERPIPYRGFLKLQLHPNGTNIYHESTLLPSNGSISLPIGSYQITFKKRGYYPQLKNYQINRNQEVYDTINLKQISYIRKLTAYVGGAYSYSSLSGISVVAGGILYNHDLQVCYTLGIDKSPIVYQYQTSDDAFVGKAHYSQNVFSVKYGYQFRLNPRLALTPQLGYEMLSLKGEGVEGAELKYGDGACCTCATVGFKFVCVPFNHFNIFVAPQYGISVKEDDLFKTIAKYANLTAGGFTCHAGLLVNF